MANVTQKITTNRKEKLTNLSQISFKKLMTTYKDEFVQDLN